MKKFFVAHCIVLLLFVALLCANAQNINAVQEAGYIQNRGQWESDVRYYTATKGMRVWVTDNALVYDVQGSEEKTGRLIRVPSKFRSMDNEWIDETVTHRHVVQMEIEGGYLGKGSGGTQLTGVYNYFYGKDESKWIHGAAKYSDVHFADVYKGIDMLLTTSGGAPRYDFVVKPGAMPNQISLTFHGAQQLLFQEDGSLRIRTSCGDIVNGNVLAYQMVGANKQQIPCTMVAKGKSVSFQLGSYDTRLPLVIDPTVYCTYIGGDDIDAVTGIARFTATGEVVATGYTQSLNFPRTPGSYTSPNSGGEDAFVVKYNDRLNTLKFATYIGGSGSDKAWDVAVLNDDVNRYIYIVGQTDSPNFPTANALSQTPRGGVDGFVIKLSNDGSGPLRYSTYYGGPAEDIIYGVAVDAIGIAYFCGETFSTTNFHIKPGSYRTDSYGGGDAFVSSLLPAGSILNYATYWGGAKRDRALALAAPPNNDNQMYVTGETKSSDIPLYPRTQMGPNIVYNPAQRYLNNTTGAGDSSDAFVIKLNDGGSSLTYSTYCGGNGGETGYGIYVDNTGAALIVGSTTSTNLVLLRSIQGNKKGGSDCLLAEVNTAGTQFTYMTYWGGNGNDVAYDVGFDGNQFLVGGRTNSSDLPVSTDAGQPDNKQRGDGLILKIAYEQQGYTSYFGGSELDEIHSVVAIDPFNSYLGGLSSSNTLPVNDSAVQINYLGKQDGFVAKYTHSSLAVSTPTSADKVCAGNPTTISWFTSNFVSTDPFLLEYSADDGKTWKIIKANHVGRSFTWNTPNDLVPSDKYRIRVTHQSSGYSALNPTAFTIRRPPTITSQIADTAICANSSVTLFVAAIGDELKYQWSKNNQPIGGATGASYTITNATAENTGTYDVRITGICNPAKQSAPIKVTINPPPVITTEPKNTDVKPGSGVEFRVVAEGKNLKYRWQKDGSNIAGAPDQATYSIANAQKFDEGKYRVIVSGDCGADTSEAATLRVDVNDVEYEQTQDGTLRILSLTPNPADAEVMVKVESLTPELHISIINALGQNVFKQAIHNQQTLLLPTRQLEQGAYKLLVETGTKRVVKNFVIVR